MSSSESRENKCCRRDEDVKENIHPGKGACHLARDPFAYPEDWSRCASCELVGHCEYALSYLRSLKSENIKGGCYFNDQLSGEENLYHVVQFVNAHQNLARTRGEKRCLEELRRTDSDSPCLRKDQR